MNAPMKNDNINRQLMRQTMEIVQDMKGEFNKEIERLKKMQPGIKFRKSNKNFTYSLEDME